MTPDGDEGASTRRVPDALGPVRLVTMPRTLLPAALLLITTSLASAQDAPPPAAPSAAPKAEQPAGPDLNAAVGDCVKSLLAMQETLDEGKDKAEWPYEGVYRVKGEIPVGYRVGGTAITATALLRAPGYAEDAERQAAVDRAVGFVCESINHPLMSEADYDAGYDVRGWGYCYALHFLCELKASAALTEARREGVEKAISFYLSSIQKTEIPEVGGWNYARPPGRDKVAQSSAFMTPAVLQVLFAAKALGYEVDPEVVKRGLDALERSRTASGAFAYAGDGDKVRREGVPGAVGRMVISETTLMLAGRSDAVRVRGALDAFIVHWEWLNKRRAQPGTHVAPYGVAPYYFYFAHYYAAQAVEMLPERERDEYRRRINELLFSVRQEDGTWNDRVFKRTANFGTSMAVMAILMPKTARPAGWQG